jgi:hypothetical protein
MGVGALAGAGLAWFALKHTRFDVREGRPGYTPNPWIGGALSVLLVARLAWRWHDGAFSQGMAPGAANASPLTLGLAAAPSSTATSTRTAMRTSVRRGCQGCQPKWRRRRR